MKELSIEEKARLYDEAVKKLRSLHDDYDAVSTLIDIKEELEHIFPELAESEDEATWLKKYVEEEISCLSIDIRDDDDRIKLKNLRRSLAWLEKQGGQKVANSAKTCKVAKFKVGDWIVNEVIGSVYQIKDCIENPNSHKYGYDLTNGGYIGSGGVNHFRLWTINDAKDGDVLADSYSKDSIIILYKGIYKERIILAHCGWNGYNLSIKTNGLGYGGLDNTNYYPATKEQRDLLFQKMKEAGYEWNAEKKELKKIEPTDEYEGLTDFERTLTDICVGWIGEEYGWKQYIKDNADVLLKIAIEKFNSVQDVQFEQNLTWSEEDEKFRKNLIELLIRLSATTRTDSTSINYSYPHEIDWLKSLKDRYTWKPSEEIMKGLNEIINKLAISPVIHEHGYLYDLMVNLRKKLKG